MAEWKVELLLGSIAVVFGLIAISIFRPLYGTLQQLG